LLDGLFAGDLPLERCEKNDWKYMIVLTLMTTWSVSTRNSKLLLALPPENHLTLEIAKGGSSNLSLDEMGLSIWIARKEQHRLMSWSVWKVPRINRESDLYQI